MNARAAIVVASVVLTCAGCSQATPEQRAREAGLAPAPPAVVAAASPEPEGPPAGSTLGSVLAIMREYRDMALPELPPPPAMTGRVGMANSNSTYRGWTTDRIDASSFDAMTDSLNAVMGRMSEEEALDFDRVVKYILMQVVKDPDVARKATMGQQMSDPELLRLVRKYVDGRTPAQLAELAGQLYEAQQRQQAVGGQSGG